MTKKEVAQRILEVGIVPVVRASSSQQAMQAAEAVCAGGIPIVEVTTTVPAAIDVIAQLSKTMGTEILIGAGTVLDAETAGRCVDAGAQFLVSPGFDAETVKRVKQLDRVMMAGALTPTEVVAAWRSGSDFVKIFPCGSVGGPKYLKALKGPFPSIPMIPTGGVNLATAADFILAGAAALGIGGELVSASALESGRHHEITETAHKYIEIIRESRRRLQN